MISFTNMLKQLWGESSTEAHNTIGTVKTIEFLESALALAEFIKFRKLFVPRWNIFF